MKNKKRIKDFPLTDTTMTERSGDGCTLLFIYMNNFRYDNYNDLISFFNFKIIHWDINHEWMNEYGYLWRAC